MRQCCGCGCPARLLPAGGTGRPSSSTLAAANSQRLSGRAGGQEDRLSHPAASHRLVKTGSGRGYERQGAERSLAWHLSRLLRLSPAGCRSAPFPQFSWRRSKSLFSQRSRALSQEWLQYYCARTVLFLQLRGC